MEKISFVTLAVSPYWVEQPVLLAESLRTFGGNLAKAPLTVLVPSGTSAIPDEVIIKLKAQNADLISIEISNYALNFPLGLLPFAAAEAEVLLKDKTEQLAWVLPDTMFLSSPESLILPQGKQLAYRPVHHSNIGSHFNTAPDAFWSLVYEHCQVPKERIFPMETCTRDKILRPYINAGILVTRPDSGFLHDWMRSFQQAYQNEIFLPQLTDKRKAIFLHQAVLSGVMMKRSPQEKLWELPETVNYPLHLHDEYPAEYRPGTLIALITCRFETVPDLKLGLEKISVPLPFRSMAG